MVKRQTNTYIYIYTHTQLWTTLEWRAKKSNHKSRKQYSIESKESNNPIPNRNENSSCNIEVLLSRQQNTRQLTHNLKQDITIYLFIFVDHEINTCSFYFGISENLLKEKKIKCLTKLNHKKPKKERKTKTKLNTKHIKEATYV